MLAIIGCGNPNRRDDGAGIYVVQQLLTATDALGDDKVSIFDAGTAGMDVIYLARGCDSLIIIDANLSRSEPGTIFEVPGQELENIPEPGYNLHDFRWDNALYAGKKIYKEAFPSDILVYLIEAKSVELGIGLSDPVREACNKVVKRVKTKIADYQLIHG